MNSTHNASNSTEEDDECFLDIHLNIYFFILQLFIILIGIPFNAFSLFVYCQHIKQKNELGIYLCNLAISDLFFIIGLPIWMDFTYNDTWRFGKTMCTVCVFLIFTNFYTSTILLSCIAIDRYLAVVHPLTFPFLRTPSTAAVVSAAVWMFTFIFNTVTILPLELYNSDYNICLDVFPLSLELKKTFLARFIVGFLLPAVVVVFCYWRICMEVRSNQATRLPERRRVFRLLGGVLLSLCLCFGPLHIAMLLRVFLENCKPPTWLYLLYKAGVALSFLNYLADPLLYAFITKTGRTSVTQAFMNFQNKKHVNIQCMK